MKKGKTLLILVLILFIQPNISGTVKFYCKYGSTSINSNITIFKNGSTIGSASSNEEFPLPLPGGTYSYKTDNNFYGDFTAPSNGELKEITLDHRKLTFNIKDDNGNPANDYIYIYEGGSQVKSLSVNGTATIYLKPSDSYSYKCTYGNQAGAVSLIEDATVELIKIEKNAPINAGIIAKYMNFPVEGQFRLFSHPATTNSASDWISMNYSNPANGRIFFTIPKPGTYWLLDQYETSTELNFTTANQLIDLNYKKIRFISNISDPNIMNEIAVNGISKMTDGKGIADFYLLPGTYTYTHLTNSESFTVTEDATINISTSKVTFILKNQDTQIPYPNQPFKVGKDMNHLSSFTTDANGICKIGLKPGAYIFSDGIGSYPFTVQENDNSITLPMYDVTFNLSENVSEMPSGNLFITSVSTGNASHFDYRNGMKINLLPGDYMININSTYIPLQVNKDITLGNYFYKYVVELTDGNNSPVQNVEYQIFKNGISVSYGTTSTESSIIAYLPTGNYKLLVGAELIPFSINSQNISTTLQIPNTVTINVTKDGLPYTGGLVVRHNSQEWNNCPINCLGGICRFRLKQGDTYYIESISNTLQNGFVMSPITVSGTSINLDFISLQIKTEGKGLAFPQNNESTTYYLKGDIVKLAAIPMQGWKCARWKINDTNIDDDMVHYTLTGSTVATAIFEQESSTGIDKISSMNNLTIYPNPASNVIYLSEEMNGRGSIYSADGRLIKDLYVFGKGVDISDLSAGVYVLSINSRQNNYKGNFIKK